MHLMTAENSWLIIPDVDSSKNNISSFTNLLSEGENISFIYNTTKTGAKCSVSIYYCKIILLFIILYYL